MVTEASSYPSFETPVGKVTIQSLTAISEREWELAREGETDLLIERLTMAGYHPINDPWRESLL
jgi:hypothetical protein